MPTATNADDLAALLERGELEVEGRLTNASNAVYRVLVDTGSGVPLRAVYKPVRGERPLWDFPHGTLAQREYAAYLISRRGGWDRIPVTVLRDGPLGPGSVQLWVGSLEVTGDHDLLRIDPPHQMPQGYLPVVQAQDEYYADVIVSHADDPALRDIALLDAVLNNADRKATALILDDGELFAIDHGLTLHEEPKLRTVLWGFAGEPLDDDQLAQLTRLGELLEPSMSPGPAEPDFLAGLVTQSERVALQRRIRRLLREETMPPVPGHRHPLPWPLW